MSASWRASSTSAPGLPGMWNSPRRPVRRSPATASKRRIDARRKAQTVVGKARPVAEAHPTRRRIDPLGSGAHEAEPGPGEASYAKDCASIPRSRSRPRCCRCRRRSARGLHEGHVHAPRAGAARGVAPPNPAPTTRRAGACRESRARQRGGCGAPDQGAPGRRRGCHAHHRVPCAAKQGRWPDFRFRRSPWRCGS